MKTNGLRTWRSWMQWVGFSLAFWLSLVGVAVAEPGDARAVGNAPSFRFGVVADIQYADKPTRGKRSYHDLANKLRACVSDFNQQSLAFVVNLGDMIDGNGAKSARELALIAGIFRQLNCPTRHVIGNHCLTVNRAALLKELGLKSSYYEFTHQNWRFFVLDGMDVSLKSPYGSSEARQAKIYLAKNPKLSKYAGGIGEKQFAWLREQLADAVRLNQRVIVFCHHPIVAAASSPSAILWNAAEVGGVLTQSGCVAAWINGHDHKGGYAFTNGIHHLTIPGMIESPAGGNSYGVAETFADRIQIVGKGSVPNRTLSLDKSQAASGGR